jgi:hypothetical protein
LTVCPVRDPQQAADVCLTELRQVFTVGEESWLMITDIAAREDWPDPLPKPAIWPPAGGASNRK